MNKNDLILIAIYDLEEEKRDRMTIEEISVFAFNKYPDQFHLRGFQEYPDHHGIHKAIYNVLKAKGYLRTANNKVKLTDFGKRQARLLKEHTTVEKSSLHNSDISSDEILEYERLVRSKGFNLFLKRNNFIPIDVDVYEFYNISVRTNKHDRRGRIKVVSELLKKVKSSNLVRVTELMEYKKTIDAVYKDISKDENSS